MGERRVPADHDEGHLVVHDGRELFRVQKLGADDEAVHLPLPHDGGEKLGEIPLHLGQEQDEAVAPGNHLVGHDGHEGGPVGAVERTPGRMGNDEAYVSGLLRGQGLGGRVRLVAHLLHDLDDPFSCFFADAGVVVEHLGDGPLGNPGQLRDFVDREVVHERAMYEAFALMRASLASTLARLLKPSSGVLKQ